MLLKWNKKWLFLTGPQKIQFFSSNREILDQLPLLYEAQGNKLGHSLRGEYNFVISDPNRQQILLGRDLLGVSPLYFTENEDEIIITDSLSKLVDVLPLETLEPNKSFFDHVLCSSFVLSRSTFINKVYSVAPGETILLKENRSLCQRKPMLKQADKSTTFDDTSADQLENLILESLHQRSKQKTVLFLSGGLDSSLLFAMAQRHQIPLKALSLSFSDGPESENTPLQILKKMFPKNLEVLKANNESVFGPWLEEDLSWYTPSLGLFTPLFLRAQELGAQKVMTGLGGDDLFTLGPAYIHQLWQESSVSHFFSQLPSYIQYHGTSEVFVNILSQIAPEKIKYIRRLQLLGSHQKLKIRDEVRKAISVQRRHFSFWQRKYPDHFLARHIGWRVYASGALQLSFNIEQERAAHFGLSMTYPLLDESLIDWVFRQPVQALQNKKQDKWVLRQLASKYLPALMAFHRSQQDYGEIDLRLWQQWLLHNREAKQNLPLDWLANPNEVDKILKDVNLQQTKWLMVHFLQLQELQKRSGMCQNPQTKNHNTQSPPLKNMEV